MRTRYLFPSLLLLAACDDPSPTPERLAATSLALTETASWVQVHNGAAPKSPSPRNYMAHAYDPIRRVTWVWGGHEAPLNPLNNEDLWSWDGRQWTLHDQPAFKPSARRFPTSTFDLKREVLVVNSGTSSGILNDSWAWNGTAWSKINEPDFGRVNTVCAYDPIHDLLLIPGGNTAGGLNFTTSVRTELTWEQPQAVFPAPLTSRVGMALAYDPKKQTVILDGGDTNDGPSLQWNVAEKRWDNFTTNFPKARLRHALVTDTSRERLIMSSAISRNFAYDDLDLLTWREWDGFNWSVIPSRYPPPRQDMALAYDSARKRVVLFGGIRYAPNSESVEKTFGDTWEYDPQLQLWTEVNVVPAPTLHPAAAYDEARERSVVLTNNGTETWLWDGFTWGRALPRTTDHPPAVSLAMAYDPVRKQVVTFGGHAPGNPASLLGDTWVWDGSDWTKASGGLALTPQPRHGHKMAWHPGRQVIVMAGGVGQNSTWEWNGSSWSETVPQALPLDLGVGHMSTDLAEGTVLFAGGDTCNTLRYLHNGASASWEIVSSCGAKLDFTASAADPFRKKILHHARQQTSQWDGAAWAPLGGSVPPAQTRFAMTFDPSKNRAFLFLGQDGSPEAPGVLRNDVWAFQVTLSGCASAPECPEGLVCSMDQCVLPGQGGGGQGGAAGSSGSSGQAGVAGAGAGGAGQAGAGNGGAGAGVGGTGGDAGTGGAGEGGAGVAGGAGEGGAGGAGAEGGAAGVSGSSGQAGAGGEGGGALPSSGGLFGVDAPDGAGSCGCEAAGRGARGGAWWGLGLGLALLRRRRARGSLAGAEFTEG